MSVLHRIVARTRADLDARRGPLEALPTPPAPPRDFAGALEAADGLALIAEFKPRSPSKGAIRPDASPEDVARLYRRHAHAMSVLCDAPFFGGGYPTLARVRAVTDLPLLAKDFVVDAYQLHEARAHGADAVLLMASVLPPAELEALLAQARALGMAALVEVHDAHELGVAVEVGARVVGVNSRDLKTLSIDLDHAARLLDAVPAGRLRVAESGLTERAAVDRVRGRADAALVGSAIMAADDPAGFMEALGWPSR